jgi:hypothetical protein
LVRRGTAAGAASQAPAAPPNGGAGWGSFGVGGRGSKAEGEAGKPLPVVISRSRRRWMGGVNPQHAQRWPCDNDEATPPRALPPPRPRQEAVACHASVPSTPLAGGIIQARRGGGRGERRRYRQVSHGPPPAAGELYRRLIKKIIGGEVVASGLKGRGGGRVRVRPSSQRFLCGFRHARVLG